MTDEKFIEEMRRTIRKQVLVIKSIGESDLSKNLRQIETGIEIKLIQVNLWHERLASSLRDQVRIQPSSKEELCNRVDSEYGHFYKAVNGLAHGFFYANREYKIDDFSYLVENVVGAVSSARKMFPLMKEICQKYGWKHMDSVNTESFKTEDVRK